MSGPPELLPLVPIVEQNVAVGSVRNEAPVLQRREVGDLIEGLVRDGQPALPCRAFLRSRLADHHNVRVTH